MGHCPCFGRREKKVIRFRNEETKDLKPTGDDTSPDNCSVKMNPNLKPSSNIPVQVPNDNGNAERNAMLFSYRELATATNNFRQESFIGEGGFGAVYKGKLERTGQIVAVKQLNHSGLQGDKEFLVEVLMLSLLRHPNLVHLIGYCAEGEQRLLVYEFMPLGSLEYHLHDLTPDMEPLDWNTRMIIAAGAAKGLDFLHNHADPPVIYRDLKSANILLGEGFYPRLSDFGLAKFGPGKDQSHVSTRVMGTQGYCAPEYAGTGKLTMKSDIYSFGVVLLELITGRRALDMTHGNGKHILVDWARPMLRDRKNFIKLADPRLKGQFSEPILRRAMEVALMCLREDPQLRPGMADVVNALEYFISQQYDSNDKRSPEGEGQINHDMESFFESKDILQETKLLDKNVDRARAVAEAKMWGELWRDKRQHRTQNDSDEVNR